jgi:hypothetical protein
VSANTRKISNNDEIFLSILAQKLSEDPVRFYTIPLLPYSLEKVQLSSIVQCQSQQDIRLPGLSPVVI